MGSTSDSQHIPVPGSQNIFDIVRDLNERVETHLAFSVEDEERIDDHDERLAVLEKQLAQAQRTIWVLWRVLESRFYYDLLTADSHAQLAARPGNVLTNCDCAGSRMFAEPRVVGCQSHKPE